MSAETKELLKYAMCAWKRVISKKYDVD